MQTNQSRLPDPALALVLALVLLALAPVPVARATTITVTTTNDELNNDGDCSLREAIQAANTDSAVDACPAGNGADTISLPSGTYTLSLPGAGEDNNATGDLDISAELVIEGTGATRPTIDANYLDRVLHIHILASTEIKFVRIVKGRTPDATGDGDGGDGGGIHSWAGLTLDDVYLGYNETGDGAGSGHGGDGGAIYGHSMMTISDTTVEANRTGLGGDNPAGRGGRGGNGAGIRTASNLVINSSNVWFNTCGDGGNGVDGGRGGFGGGLYLHQTRFRLNDSQVSGNHAGDGGNSIAASGDGGQGGHGGGIYAYGGQVKPFRSRFAVNQTGKGGNGSGTGDNGDGGFGAGIYLNDDGVLTLENCTLNGNKTEGAGSGGTGGVRGNGGGIHAQGEATLINSTISNNEANQGGGLSFDLTSADVSISVCTIAENTAGGFGGGLVQTSGPTVALTGTIIANNGSSGMGPDCFTAGTLTSHGYNLVEDTSNCTFPVDPTDITGAAPALAGLADNGGPTFTHALQAGSPAINHIPDGSAGCQAGESIDQRGVVRAGGTGKGGSACDTGAYEYGSGPTLRFESTAYATDEYDGTAAISVLLVPAWDTQITVDYATSDGTATAAQDYTPNNGTLTFEPGEDQVSFDIAIFDDDDNEGIETVFLDLSDPANALLGAPARATLSIDDPDDQPYVRLTSTEYWVAETAGAATISVWLDEPSPRLVEVHYETYSGTTATAIAGSDYMTATGTLPIFPGSLEGAFTVTILDDDLEEGSEFTRLRIFDAVNARTNSPAYGKLTIIDDESAGPIFLPQVLRNR